MIGSVKKIRIKSKAQDDQKSQYRRKIQAAFEGIGYGVGVWKTPTFLYFEHLSSSGKNSGSQLYVLFRETEGAIVEKYLHESFIPFTNEELKIIDNFGLSISLQHNKIYKQNPEDWFDNIPPVTRYRITLDISHTINVTTAAHASQVISPHLVRLLNQHQANLVNVLDPHELVIEGYGESEGLRLYHTLTHNWKNYFNADLFRVTGMKREVFKE